MEYCINCKRCQICVVEVTTYLQDLANYFKKIQEFSIKHGNYGKDLGERIRTLEKILEVIVKLKRV